MLDISFAKPQLPGSGALALLLEEGDPSWPLLQQADQATGGAVSRALSVARFTGKRDQVVTILAPGGGLSRVVVVGLGKAGDLSERRAEAAGGHLAAALASEPEAQVATGGLSGALAARVALGAALRAYRFDRYRTRESEDEKPKLARLTVQTAHEGKARAAWEELAAVARGVFVTRDLVSEPPNVLTPPEMAERCAALTALGLKVEVLGPAELRTLGMGALLGVAQGSALEPRVVVMEWHGAKGRKAAKPLAFIGKGVTFDTGGISIKPAAGMEEMKWDMAGAGAVVGLMAALAGRKARVNAVGIVGLVENMPSGTAQRPGDVVTTASGQTVEIINTDAEGRLVLADVLWYCQHRFAPRLMIDLATLTGAMIVALGHEQAGFFSNDDELAERLHAAGRASGDKLWRMPLGRAYDRQLKSDIADMKNTGPRWGGAITAAEFVHRFVGDTPWAHLDIAGVAWSGKDSPTIPKGATAFGVRALERLVADYYEG